jgi:hypothetical protein
LALGFAEQGLQSAINLALDAGDEDLRDELRYLRDAVQDLGAGLK